MRRITITTILYFLLFPLILLSQNENKWDKELSILLSKRDISDSLRIVFVSDLFLNNRHLLDENSLHTYLEIVLPLVSQNNKDETKTYIYTSAILLTNNIEQKLPLLDSCIFYLDKIDNHRIRAIGWNNIGKAQVRDARSLNYFQNALDEIKEKGYYLEEANIYTNMASFYKNQKDHSNQVRYSEQALESAQKASDKISIAKAWNSLGEAYVDIPTDDFNIKSLEAFTTALNIYNEIIQVNDSGRDDYLHINLHINLGIISYYSDEYEAAIKKFQEALILTIQYNITECQILCYKYLASIEQDKEQYQKAADYLLKAEVLLPEISFYNENNWYLLYGIYFDLAEVYKNGGMLKESAKYLQIGLEEYRKVFDLQLAYDSQLLTSSYEVQQKKQEIEDTRSLFILKDRQTFLYIGVAVILCIGLFFIYKLSNYRISIARQEERRESKKIELLKLEKSYITLQNELKLQESEELQKQLAFGNVMVEQKNKIFENLKEFFTAHPEFNEYKEQIESILSQQNRVENNVEDLKNISEGVPTDFYARLQEYANNKLTLLDLKYCRLIYLDTPTKEMANQLYVEPNTIRVSKYRLKQKLNLEKDADLNLFIQNIAKQEI